MWIFTNGLIISPTRGLVMIKIILALLFIEVVAPLLLCFDHTKYASHGYFQDDKHHQQQE
jgi:hypothetical protein